MNFQECKKHGPYFPRIDMPEIGCQHCFDELIPKVKTKTKGMLLVSVPTGKSNYFKDAFLKDEK